jgi:hypothetical protein
VPKFELCKHNDELFSIYYNIFYELWTCEFPIGSYGKLSSAVVAILVEGPNHWTHFWKRTIQWLFHQNFVLIEQMVSDKKIFTVDGPLPKLCPVIPTSNQDGHQAKNRKKGGWNLIKSSPLKLLSQSQQNLAEMILRWSPFTFFLLFASSVKIGKS